MNINKSASGSGGQVSLECELCESEYDMGGRMPIDQRCCLRTMCKECMEYYSGEDEWYPCAFCNEERKNDGQMVRYRNETIISLIRGLNVESGR